MFDLVIFCFLFNFHWWPTRLHVFSFVLALSLCMVPTTDVPNSGLYLPFLPLPAFPALSQPFPSSVTGIPRSLIGWAESLSWGWGANSLVINIFICHWYVWGWQYDWSIQGYPATGFEHTTTDRLKRVEHRGTVYLGIHKGSCRLGAAFQQILGVLKGFSDTHCSWDHRK